MPADKALMEKVKRILKDAFPDDTVDVSPGYHENMHVVVVSRQFDSEGEKQKQEHLWGVIDASDLTEAQKSQISLILPYSPAELK